ncbi:hypothetical protein [Streptomyces sp. NPDC093594]|uniref:hypothetical protein n=1 Tax=Streptomyces sp. NPDC093594 TaxID=3155305 RepID=UPI00344C1C9F
MPVDHEVDLVVEGAGQPVQEAAHHLGGEALGEDHAGSPGTPTEARRGRFASDIQPRRSATTTTPTPDTRGHVTGALLKALYDPRLRV